MTAVSEMGGEEGGRASPSTLFDEHRWRFLDKIYQVPLCPEIQRIFGITNNTQIVHTFYGQSCIGQGNAKAGRTREYIKNEIHLKKFLVPYQTGDSLPL